jgi:sec-independent protein translocase protein TatA
MFNSTLLIGLGVTEIVLIIAVVLLLFGGKKIPELMRGMGKGIKEFKSAQSGEENSPNSTNSSSDERKVS